MTAADAADSAASLAVAAAAAAEAINPGTAMMNQTSCAAAAVVPRTVFPKAFDYVDAACPPALPSLKLLLPLGVADAAWSQVSSLTAEMWAAVLSLLGLLCSAGPAATGVWNSATAAKQVQSAQKAGVPQKTVAAGPPPLTRGGAQDDPHGSGLAAGYEQGLMSAVHATWIVHAFLFQGF